MTRRWIKTDVGDLEALLDGLVLVRAQLDTAESQAERLEDSLLRYQLKAAKLRLDRITQGFRTAAATGEMGHVQEDMHRAVERRS